MSNLKDKMWLTCKARMISEKRYRLYDVTSHLFLTYISLLMIVASVFFDELALEVPNFRIITIILALFLFATSLIIYGFKFSEMANKHRDCYLKLQGLEQDFDHQSDPGSAYQEILSCYPNHAQRDFEDLVLARTCFGKSNLQSGEKEITWTISMLLKKIIRIFGFCLLILSPPILVTFLFLKSFIIDIIAIQ